MSCSRGWLLALVIAGVLSAGGWVWWSATQRADIGFLPQQAGGHWIVYPTEFDQGVGRPVELSTVFQKSFTLEQVPARAVLSVVTFHTGRVSINGVEVSPVTEPRKNWKTPEVLDVSRYLRTGTNHLTITVSNSNGPPALWLSLEADAVPAIASGEDWQCTYAGAVLRPARLATRPKVVSPGNAVSGGPEPWASLCARRLTLLCFVALAAGAAWSLSWLGRRKGLAFARPERGSLPEAGSGHEAGKLGAPAASPTRNRWWVEALPLALVAVLWVALFANNASVLPSSVGFDADGHLDYIRHVQEHRRLPLANEGWEMFQPPMYYALSAGVLGMLSLSAGEPDGVLALRWFGLVIGLVHVGLVWASMRLLFPAPSGGGKFSANWSAQWFGVLLAGCLPSLIYISHYVTNEGLGAMLVSGSVYLTLRCVKAEYPSWKLAGGLGLCLGAALLTKSTALVAVPVVVGAIIWRGLNVADGGPGEDSKSKIGSLNSSGRFAITAQLSFWVWRGCLVLTVCGFVCGWHYARVWSRFGRPLVGNWEAASGFSWWQDPGFRTSAGYLRFGSVLRDPWAAGNASFGDGLYATLWGDGLFGGTLVPTFRPPWNYELMAASYWLALVPTLLLVIGGMLAGARWIRRLSVEWSLLLGLGFLIATAIIQISLVQPAYSTAKAFYGLSALIPFCACAAAGWGLLTARRTGIWGRWAARSLCVMFGVWALNSYASFWIVRHSGPVSVLRAWSLLDRGQEREAAAALQAYLRSDPSNADARCLLAAMLLDAGAADKTIQQASLVLGQQPDHAMAHHLLGGGLARMQQIGDGLAHARRAVELAPGWGAPYEKLTELLLWQHRNDEAVEVGRAGLAVVPFSRELRQTLGTALLACGKPAEAEAQFTVFIGLTPDQAQAHCRAAMAFQSAHEISFAVTHYQKAIQFNPNLAEALANLAWIRAANAQAEFRNGTEAVELAERASRLTGGQDMAALATLAVAYAEAGRFAEATEAATRARDRALAGSRKDLAETNQRLVELFTAHQPFHEPSRR